MFVQEVASALMLGAVELAHELQVYLRTDLLAAYFFWIASLFAELLQGTPRAAGRTPNQHVGLLGVHELPRLSPLVGLFEVPRLALRVGGSEVQGEAGRHIFTGHHLKDSRHARRRVHLGDSGLHHSPPFSSVLLLGAADFLDDVQDLLRVLSDLLFCLGPSRTYVHERDHLVVGILARELDGLREHELGLGLNEVLLDSGVRAD